MIGGAAPEVLDRAERAAAALGFSPYRGNPGMVVGSDADPTLLTPGAMAIGFVLLPITIATSPIAAAIGKHDSAAWWPLAAFCLERRSWDERIVYISVSDRGNTTAAVDVRVQDVETRARETLGKFWALLDSNAHEH